MKRKPLPPHNKKKHQHLVLELWEKRKKRRKNKKKASQRKDYQESEDPSSSNESIAHNSRGDDKDSKERPYDLEGKLLHYDKCK